MGTQAAQAQYESKILNTSGIVLRMYGNLVNRFKKINKEITQKFNETDTNKSINSRPHWEQLSDPKDAKSPADFVRYACLATSSPAAPPIFIRENPLDEVACLSTLFLSSWYLNFPVKLCVLEASPLICPLANEGMRWTCVRNSQSSSFRRTNRLCEDGQTCFI